MTLTLAEAFEQALKAVREIYADDEDDEFEGNIRWRAETLIAEQWPQYKNTSFETVWDSEDEEFCRLAVEFLGCESFDDNIYQYFIGTLLEIRNGTDGTKAGDEKLTVAQALGEGVATLIDRDILRVDMTRRTAEQVIDYGYKHLRDQPFQTVWDGEKREWWLDLLQQVCGGANDPDVLAILLEELGLIRERLPALGKQSSQPPGDQWMSPGRMVCSWPDLDITARAVLFVMAAHGNNKGENIWISQQKIADYLGLKHKRTAQKATKRLRQAGAITKTAEPRQHKPTTYKINHGPRVT